MIYHDVIFHINTYHSLWLYKHKETTQFFASLLSELNQGYVTQLLPKPKGMMYVLGYNLNLNDKYVRTMFTFHEIPLCPIQIIITAALQLQFTFTLFLHQKGLRYRGSSLRCSIHIEISFGFEPIRQIRHSHTTLLIIYRSTGW